MQNTKIKQICITLYIVIVRLSEYVLSIKYSKLRKMKIFFFQNNKENSHATLTEFVLVLNRCEEYDLML